METTLTQLINFLHIVERLKTVLRHSWLTSGRQESVAEHSWRLALMVMLLAPHNQPPIDTGKAIKMAIIHDIAEAITGDIPIFESQGQSRQQQKMLAEQTAIAEMRSILHDKIGDELFTLWQEYENKTSNEARFVNALDKIEAQLQHNEADLTTWLEQEKLMIFQHHWIDRHCEFNELTQFLNKLVKQQAIAKLAQQGEDITALQTQATDQLNN